MTELQGGCSPQFDAVREALQNNIRSGEELGASLVVDIDGVRVVDLWGGFRDEARTDPWDEHTIVNLWSATKTVTSLAALLLVDRGDLDPYAPVARYWPEFATQSKGAVEVRHLMSHTSGVSGLEQPATVEDLYDRDASTTRYAAQAPWWIPGTASGYHVTNYGHLIGELVRRVTGATLREFVADEIAGPLGADLQLGASPADHRRIAPIVPPPAPPESGGPAPGSVPAKTFAGPAIDATYANTASWRRAEIGALNGHGNARSLARVLSVVARSGEVDGVRLLRPATIDLIFDEQARGVDLVLGIPLRWGIGFALPEPATLPWIPDERICFWGGWGGSMIIMDAGRRMTISYVMNRMAPGIIGSERSAAYVQAVYDSTG